MAKLGYVFFCYGRIRAAVAYWPPTVESLDDRVSEMPPKKVPKWDKIRLLDIVVSWCTRIELVAYTNAFQLYFGCILGVSRLYFGCISVVFLVYLGCIYKCTPSAFSPARIGPLAVVRVCSRCASPPKQMYPRSSRTDCASSCRSGVSLWGGTLAKVTAWNGYFRQSLANVWPFLLLDVE